MIWLFLNLVPIQKNSTKTKIEHSMSDSQFAFGSFKTGVHRNFKFNVYLVAVVFIHRRNKMYKNALGPVVQSLISINHGLTTEVLLRVNPGIPLIEL